MNTSVEGYDSSFVSEGLGFESYPGHLLDDYSWFCQTIHAPVSTPQPFPSASLPVYCSLIIRYNFKHYKRNEITKSRNTFLGKIILRHVWLNRSHDGSVGITIRPWNRPSKFGAITGEARDFFLLRNVQTGPGMQPAGAWNSPLASVSSENEWTSTSAPPICCM